MVWLRQCYLIELGQMGIHRLRLKTGSECRMKLQINAIAYLLGFLDCMLSCHMLPRSAHAQPCEFCRFSFVDDC